MLSRCRLAAPTQVRQQLISLRSFRPACAAATSEPHAFQVSSEEVAAAAKTRLDAYLATKLPTASRGRLQASIREGLVAVNGRVQGKASYTVKPGDAITCSVLPPPPLEAGPEDLPLDIVYEDDQVLVINKAAEMVMHPSPGHYSGTVVNALLHHCGLPPVRVAVGEEAPVALGGEEQQLLQQEGAAGVDAEDFDDDDDIAPGSAAVLVFASDANAASAAAPTIRPGIVHRLDKGTTGLVVVAKTDAAHASLSLQFKDRSVQRTYVSVLLRTPHMPAARVATNVGRDMRDRKKMAAFAYDSARGRLSASNYRVLEELCDGRAALVQWRLETGRTHQIRVHAKYIGHPLVGDDLYGGGTGTAVSVLAGGKAAVGLKVQRMVQELGRPALHAKTLGFVHPTSGRQLQFDSDLPSDLLKVLDTLRTGFE